MATTITMIELFRLLTWLSPAYPVGGFSYSHGLEMAVEEGAVTSRAALQSYIEAVLLAGAGRVDAALLVAAHRAVGDDAALDEVAELASAWRGSGETALEATQQGGSFASITNNVWPHAGFAAFSARHTGRLTHAVAFGAAAGCHGMALRPALVGWLSGFAANLVSAGVRLVPLGQTDGQRVTAALFPIIEQAADAAEAASLDRLGTAAPMLDQFSLRHETQYTRLFRS
jgi:urease accessory protein